MEINSNLSCFFNCYSGQNHPLGFPQGLMEIPPISKNFQEIEDDTISFVNSNVETEWEQYPFQPIVENLTGLGEASSENSVYAHDGSFSEKDDDFTFGFEENIDKYIDVCYFQKDKYVSNRRKMKRVNSYQKKRRNVLLEGWICIRKFFLNYLTCKSALNTIKKDFYANFKLWRSEFKSYHKVFMKFANRIPRNKVSLGFLEKEYPCDPHRSVINQVLRSLFARFVDEKAAMWVNRLENISSTMRDVLFEMIVLIKNSLPRNIGKRY